MKKRTFSHFTCLFSSVKVRIMKQLRIYRYTFLTCPKKKKSGTNIATLLFNNCHKPSIHGVCQCLDLLTINFLCSSGVQGPQVLNGVRSGEEGGHVIIFSSLRLLLASHAVEYFDACHGALSYIKIMIFLKDADFFLYHCLKKSVF